MVDIVVLPMGLQTPSAPTVLSLTPPLGSSTQSKGWLQVSTSVLVRIRQSLSGDSYFRCLSANTSWHQQQCLGLVSAYGMDPQVGQSLDGFSFSLCSTFCLCISSHWYFVSPSKNDQSIHTLFFFLLELHVFCELYIGYFKLLG